MHAQPSSRIFTLARLVVVAAALAMASGCVYRMNIQQGNFLEESAIAQVQVGMTRSQVRYLLGTPMVPDAFDRDRWDYLYYFRGGRRLKTPDERHLIVWFKDDKVERMERKGDLGPVAPPPKDEALRPIAPG